MCETILPMFIFLQKKSFSKTMHSEIVVVTVVIYDYLLSAFLLFCTEFLCYWSIRLSFNTVEMRVRVKIHTRIKECTPTHATYFRKVFILLFWWFRKIGRLKTKTQKAGYLIHIPIQTSIVMHRYLEPYIESLIVQPGWMISCSCLPRDIYMPK